MIGSEVANCMLTMVACVFGCECVWVCLWCVRVRTCVCVCRVCATVCVCVCVCLCVWCTTDMLMLFLQFVVCWSRRVILIYYSLAGLFLVVFVCLFAFFEFLCFLSVTIPWAGMDVAMTTAGDRHCSA